MRLTVNLITAASCATVLAVVAEPAIAAAPTALPAAAAPVTVARYTFDAGLGTGGRIPDTSGRGTALTVRTADGGRVSINGTGKDKYASFPAACAATATRCPRALLEGTDDADLDPGIRRFRWGASVRVTTNQLTRSSNVVQKGVVDTASQWKLQIGSRGKPNCVVVGQGSSEIYLARSTVGVADGRWHNLLCLRSGNLLAVYVDGKPTGRRVIPATVSISNNMKLRIGGPNFNTKSDMYHGLLDDVFAILG
jgi:hypothetical protein